MVSQIQQRRGDVGLAQRVNGRVSHLREQLVEVVVEASRTLREARERRVLAHGRQRNGPGIGHGNDGLLDVLEAEAVYGLSLRKGDVRIVGMTRILFRAKRIKQRSRMGSSMERPLKPSLFRKYSPNRRKTVWQDR